MVLWVFIFVKGFSLSAPAREVFSKREICFICLSIFFSNSINLVCLFICFTPRGGEKEEGK